MSKIDDMLCSADETLKDAMLCIGKNKKKIAFIIDINKKMVGILSDGDIRRQLLNGYGLNEKVENCMNKNFACATSITNAREILTKNAGHFSIVPILDKERHVIDFIETNENFYVQIAQPQLNGNEYKYLTDALLSSWISSMGKYIDSFEGGFSKYCGMRYGVSTSNGTSALHLALSALGIKEGDEVIVPDLTFAATINSVIYTGARPVIVDVERDSWCISPEKIEASITRRTKAIIPVHLYGQPCDMGRVCEIARKNNLFIVEDCAEAHGAEWNKKKIGSFGDISCFSFFGNKVVTTGEGGMCLTQDARLNEKMRLLRDHGMNRSRKYYHEIVGYNYRMTNMQAAIGTAQIERIDDILNWRAELENKYRLALGKQDGIEFQRNNLKGRKKIAWLVSILVKKEKRNIIIDTLKNNGIDARPFFTPLSKMEIYEKYAKQGNYYSWELSDMGINLPTSYEISDEIIERISDILKECLS